MSRLSDTFNVAIFVVIMSTTHLICWNVRGLNSSARRSVVRGLLSLERVSLLCLQETKVTAFTTQMLLETVGVDYDSCVLPAASTTGGVLLAWRRDEWSVLQQTCMRFSVSVLLQPLASAGSTWWLTTVYGPSQYADKAAFLDELKVLQQTCFSPWLLCGDFNLILQDSDKNNGRLHRSWLRRFRSTIDDLQLAELHLNGRLYTWSSERLRPTLERLDQAFADADWLDAFPNHYLSCLSTDCSDHAPLSLKLDSGRWAKPRFRFEAIWPKFDGYLEAIKEAWVCPLPHACRVLDYKLRNTAKVLKAWSAKHVGSIRLQLIMARQLVKEFDKA